PTGAGASVALCSRRCIWYAPLSEPYIGGVSRVSARYTLPLFFKFWLRHWIVLDPTLVTPQLIMIEARALLLQQQRSVWVRHILCMRSEFRGRRLRLRPRSSWCFPAALRA